jgi:hypothetical protein
MRDAVGYFELTASQLAALTRIDASWLEYRAGATERADRIAMEIEQETAGLPRIVAGGAPGSGPERFRQACQALTEGSGGV